MIRFTLLFVWVLLAITGCNLANESVTPTATRVVLLPTNTLTPTHTVTVAPSNTFAPTPTTLPNCFPRADWGNFIYRVVAGDTLAQIAARVGATPAAIAEGNCLADPNRIVVGQVLRLPRPYPTNTLSPTFTLSRTSTPSPTHTAIVFEPVEGGILFSEFISADAGNFNLLRGSTIELVWELAPAQLGTVSFLLADPDYPNSPSAVSTVIGTDSDRTDGVSISWVVPASLNGKKLFASALRPNGQTVTSFAAYVYSAPPVGQGCLITVSAFNGVNVYREPNYNAAITGQLTQGATVELVGRSNDGWYGFESHEGVGLVQVRWLSIEDPFTFSGNC
ncbi:MAG: LysM peptidoglycan-binding domain-containing protein [Anaerolineae bacterium]|jgi:hypothetical protein|nr:LysM peptidoglycan-binding domain-containing protein [Anaerolineae bacterium]